MNMADRAHLQRLSRELSDQGKLIEAGWVGFRLMSVPPDAPAVQLDEMHNAFFAGAQHLFSSILTILEPGDDATEPDVSRLDLIDLELKTFIEDFKLRIAATKGRA